MLKTVLLGCALVISAMTVAISSIVSARNTTTRVPLAQAFAAVIVAALGGGAIAAGFLLNFN